MALYTRLRTYGLYFKNTDISPRRSRRLFRKVDVEMSQGIVLPNWNDGVAAVLSSSLGYKGSPDGRGNTFQKQLQCLVRAQPW